MITWKRIACLAVVTVLAVAPLYLSVYDLSLLGRFLALAIGGIGISLIWGYAGILSLGQGVFFGIGAYALAMHLKLVGSTGLPDFMLWNGVESLPWWWSPFRYPAFAVGSVVLLPAAASGCVAWLVFSRRITGVYVSLITQALALAFSTLLISQQGTTGGFNGLTDFSTLFGHSLNNSTAQVCMYWITLGVLTLSFIGGSWLTSTHLGKLLISIRDNENRVRFLGYNPAAYKTLVFAVNGALAGVSGALYTLHTGVISPAMIGVVPSIEMVIWVAFGGRDSLVGAILGTVLGNLAKDRISSAFPELWLYVMGALFIFVVTTLPRGLTGGLKVADSMRPRHRAKHQPLSEPVAPPTPLIASTPSAASSSLAASTSLSSAITQSVTNVEPGTMQGGDA